MIQALGNVSGLSIDAEYLRIIQELRKLGQTPSGSKDVDAQRLAQAKAALVNKIKANENQNDIKSLGIQIIQQVDDTEFLQRTEMEEQRLGAMNVAQLNKIFFGL